MHLPAPRSLREIADSKLRSLRQPAELVELTPESKKIKAAQDAAKAEQQRRARAEQAEEQRRARAELRARCAEVYKATIDKKISELTVREEEQVRACRTLGPYPP
jgi:hypothetical protein